MVKAHPDIARHIADIFDEVIAYVHYYLVWGFLFKCIGTEYDFNYQHSATESDDIPDGWKNNDGKYRIRYLTQNKIYILEGEIIAQAIKLELKVDDTHQRLAVIVNTTKASDLNYIKQMLDSGFNIRTVTPSKRFNWPGFLITMNNFWKNRVNTFCKVYIFKKFKKFNN